MFVFAGIQVIIKNTVEDILESPLINAQIAQQDTRQETRLSVT